MNTLRENWLTEGLIDYEYKKYILLAYLKSTREAFARKELYPHLNDLIFHYQNLLKVKENKQLYHESFPKTVSHADFQRLKLVYKEIVQDDELMREIEEIVYYALPLLKDTMEEGKELYEFLEENIEIAPIGITPLYSDEGYFFLSPQLVSEILIFRYKISIFERASERFRGIHTELLERAQRHIGLTYETIKMQLVRQYQHLPNPATFLVVSHVACPIEETLLPISKRMLVQHIQALRA